ncbi:MAG: aconitate hydratase, partial [Proteobacteria bacterium]
IEFLHFTGRNAEQCELVEEYARAQGVFLDGTQPDAIYTDVLELDMGTVVPSMAGPARPQDRVELGQVRGSFETALVAQKDRALEAAAKKKTLTTYGANLGVADDAGKDMQDGAVVIAAITSCTNTSNASAMMAAGLLAKKAVEKGLTTKPWVKTSLAPGSRVATEYLNAAGLTPSLEALRFHTVGYGCTTCIGNSGPLPGVISKEIEDRGLVVSSVLSGNRNFEGRVHAEVRANYLASPPLVVAYALAGTVQTDLTKDPLGKDQSGNDVFLKDIWPSQREVSDAVSGAINSAMFTRVYDTIFAGDASWQKLEVAASEQFAWETDSTYVRNPPYFDGMSKTPAALKPIKG